jgi:ribosomal protein S12 methylthiotransferase accessory factor
MSATIQLSSRYINPGWELMPYQMSDEQHDGLFDLLRFYGPEGPIRKVVSYFGDRNCVPIYVGHSQNYDLDYVLRKIIGLSGINLQVGKTLFAGGKGHDLFGMFVSSVSETVERALGAMEYFSKTQDMVLASYAQLTRKGYRCLGPAELPLFAPEQFRDADFPYVPFTEDSQVAWVQGKRLRSGEPIWMPMQLVAIFYLPQPHEAAIGYSTSGGLASHISERESLYHGITELFERDAVNLHWYCKIPPQIISIDRMPRLASLRRLLSVQNNLDGELKFYLHCIDTPEIPVITAIKIADWFTRYAYYSGGGVAMDIDECMLSALTEYGQAERNLHTVLVAPESGLSIGIKRLFDVDADVDSSKMNIFFKVVVYYGYKQNLEKMRWYTDTDRRVRLSELPTLPTTATDTDGRWNALMKILDRHNIDPIVFDFTPGPMKHIRLMKVYIPELAPPFLPARPLLGHPRYYTTPQKMGLLDRKLRFDELITDVLPYP